MRGMRWRRSSEIAAEIERLEDERRWALGVEDRHRGELLRDYLAGSHGEALRSVLAQVVDVHDAFLFDINPLTLSQAPRSGRRSPKAAAAPVAEGQGSQGSG